jgi:hypothetical protein
MGALLKGKRLQRDPPQPFFTENRSPVQALRYLLNQSSVRCQASFAAASS